MPLYRMTFEATPSSSHPLTHEVGGAIIACWQPADSLEEAVVVAVRHLRECKWILDEPDEAFELGEDEDDEAERRAIGRAWELGGYFVEHHYPVVDAEDGLGEQ